ncbi:hypothetical protein [Priestia aryabhattai]|uniref:hypothetical protein n=1 Tax=Priestia aryabhattai TaxID=412384 RepID=UPI002E2335E6|nr:hypothetical protein [Priestia aryabhattai]
MHSSIFTTKNQNRGTLESRINYNEKLKALASKNSQAVILTFPDGTEKEFSSAMKASIYLKASQTLVGNWIKKGNPVRGKFKGYSARLAEK